MSFTSSGETALHDTLDQTETASGCEPRAVIGLLWLTIPFIVTFERYM